MEQMIFWSKRCQKKKVRYTIMKSSWFQRSLMVVVISNEVSSYSAARMWKGSVVLEVSWLIICTLGVSRWTLKTISLCYWTLLSITIADFSPDSYYSYPTYVTSSHHVVYFNSRKCWVVEPMACMKRHALTSTNIWAGARISITHGSLIKDNVAWCSWCNMHGSLTLASSSSFICLLYLAPYVTDALQSVNWLWVIITFTWKCIRHFKW